MRVSDVCPDGMQIFAVEDQGLGSKTRPAKRPIFVAIEKSFVVGYSPSSLVLVSRTLGVVLGGHLVELSGSLLQKSLAAQIRICEVWESREAGAIG
jgi:hypothetical protein